MGLHKLTAGDGYTYLTRQVAAGDSTERGFTSLGEYYSAKGEAPGVWTGRGLASLGTAGTVSERQMRNLFGQGIHPDAQRVRQDAYARGLTVPQAVAATRLGRTFPAPRGHEEWRNRLGEGYAAWNTVRGLPSDWPIPPSERQRVRTDVARLLFQERHDRDPVDERELTGFLAQMSRPDASPVAGYDLTFTPVKSVSTLWAVAPIDVSRAVEAAHAAAVADTLAWLEDHAGYTRIGPRGVAQVPVRGFVAAAFTHRDSRAGDPDLHTHVAVSNKVQTLDGRWLTLDGRMIHRFAVAASERYNTLLEQEITRRVGGRFAERPTVTGKRAVRELVGIDPALAARWSSRARQIEQVRTDLVTTFRADHGRLPTAVELIDLSQQATLTTRQAKHEPRSHADQRATWRAEAIGTLGTEVAVEQMVARVIDRPAAPSIGPVADVEDLAVRTVTQVQASRATWRYHHLLAEAARQVRATGLAVDGAKELIERVAATAIGAEHSIPLDTPEDLAPAPGQLLRPDGVSVFNVAHSGPFTSAEILRAEQAIVTAAGRHGARTVPTIDVDAALGQWSQLHAGRVLNAGQVTLVRQVATTDHVVQLALAPAGTGKTTAMSALAAAWTRSGGTVLGLAPQASAAQELAAAIPGIVADTLDKLVYDTTHTPPWNWPDWIHQVDHTSLVIIDEAGLASTPNLDKAIGFIIERGGRVLLVGDDRQRAATGAGGVLRDIEATHGAFSLSEVLRFTDPVEGHASLAVRAGDPSAVGYYADHGRIRAVLPDTAADTVFTAWLADTQAGADSIMIAPTLDQTADLNRRARHHRLIADGGLIGPERLLPNGETISAGDVIVTKRNARDLTLGGAGFVRNNDRWTVTAVNPDQSITAAHLATGISRRLPAWYLDRGHARLGYAHTHASVQGMTVGRAHHRRGTAHAIVVDSMTRNDLYPAITRAADGTTAYVVTPGRGDPHEAATPDAIQPRSAAETLAAIITREGSAASATSETRIALDPFTRLGHAADAYLHTVLTAARTLIGPQRLAEITDAAENLRPGLTAAPAWDTLHDHLAMIATRGADPLAALRAALEAREIDTATDPAAVLDWRLDPTGRHGADEGPLPWLPAIPAAVADAPTWSPYLAARADHVRQLTERVSSAAREWTPGTAPAWAVPYLTDPDLTVDLAVWRAAESVPTPDPRPAGEPARRIAMAQRQRDLVGRALAVTGDPRDGADRWSQHLGSRAATIVEDGYWPVLAARLTLAERAGLPADQLLGHSLAQPLPAETAAAALWWRLTPHLGAVADTPTAGAHHLRPDWGPLIADIVGDQIAARITDDALWPTIVARVDRATRDGLDPHNLVTDAASVLARTADHTPANDAATVLLWTIGTLADPEPPDPETAPPDPADDDLLPPPDAHTITPDPAAEAPMTEVSTDRLYDALAAAQDYFTENAPRSWVPAYLTSRGLDPAIAGRAPDSWTALTDHLRERGFSDAELVDAGLSRVSSRGTLIDTFRNRATLPIHTPDGRVAGFIARKHPSDRNDDNPKYLNSPSTAVYDKSSLPYGLDTHAVSALRSGADLVIVEGPLDVAAINRAVPADEVVAIAATGTSLTTDQLRALDQIAPLVDRSVVVAMDNDVAGRAAATRAYRVLADVGVTDAEVVELSGKDPGEELQDGGVDALVKVLRDRRPLADLVVDEIINRWPIHDGTPESRVNAMHAAAPFIAGLPDELELRETVRISASLDIDSMHVTNEVRKHRGDEPYRTQQTGVELPDSLRPGILGRPAAVGSDLQPRPGESSSSINTDLTLAEVEVAVGGGGFAVEAAERTVTADPLVSFDIGPSS